MAYVPKPLKPLPEDEHIYNPATGKLEFERDRHNYASPVGGQRENEFRNDLLKLFAPFLVAWAISQLISVFSFWFDLHGPHPAAADAYEAFLEFNRGNTRIVIGDGGGPSIYQWEEMWTVGPSLYLLDSTRVRK